MAHSLRITLTIPAMRTIIEFTNYKIAEGRVLITEQKLTASSWCLFQE